MAVHPVPLQDPLNRRLTSGYEYARFKSSDTRYLSSKQTARSLEGGSMRRLLKRKRKAASAIIGHYQQTPSLGVDFAQELFAVPLKLFLSNALNIQELSFILRAGKAHSTQGRI